MLDVREPHEVPIANLGAPLIPVGELEKRIGELAAHKNRRGHHSLPFGSAQPEGGVDPEGGWIHECVEPCRRHPGLGGQDRSDDAEVLSLCNSRRTQRRRIHRVRRLFFAERGTQGGKRAVGRRRSEAEGCGR